MVWNGALVFIKLASLMENSHCSSQMAKSAWSKHFIMDRQFHWYKKGLRQKRTGSKSVPDSQTSQAVNSTEPADQKNSTPILSPASTPMSLIPPVLSPLPHLHRLLSLSHSLRLSRNQSRNNSLNP